MQAQPVLWAAGAYKTRRHPQRNIFQLKKLAGSILKGIVDTRGRNMALDRRVAMLGAVCLTWTVVIAQTQSGLLVTFPSTLLLDTEETVCFTTAGLTGQYMVTLMATFDGDCPIVMRHWSGTEGDVCMPLQVSCGDAEGAPRNAVLRMTLHGSSDGQEITHREYEQTVAVAVQRLETFIQSDKPMYQPGQKVMFRVLTVKYPGMLPEVDSTTTVWMESPSGTRLQQWNDLQSPDGLHDLDFTLSSEPELGEWRIKVSVNGRHPTVQTFTVEEYVLPKFEVTVSGPSYIYNSDETEEDISIKVCAIYTYGQPVQGSFVVTEAVHEPVWAGVALLGVGVEVDEATGCGSVLIPRSDVFPSYSTTGVRFSANVTERGTDVSIQGTSSSIPVVQGLVNLEIISPSTCKPGLPYRGHVRATYPDGAPVPSLEIQLSGHRYHVVTTGSDGYASFELTPFFVPDIPTMTITATPRQPMSRKPYISKTVTAWFSPSTSFLDVAPVDGIVTPGQSVQLTLNFTLPDDAPSQISFLYRVVSRGRIVAHGEETWTSPSTSGPDVAVNIDADAGTGAGTGDGAGAGDGLTGRTGTLRHWHRHRQTRQERGRFGYPYMPPEVIAPEWTPYRPVQTGLFQFTIDATGAMSPIGRVLVYYIRSDGEVVSASTSFKIAPTFANQVSVEFPEGAEVRPGHPVSLAVTAQPSSLCAVGVVDKSVHVMGGNNQLTQAKVFSPAAGLSEVSGSIPTSCPTEPTEPDHTLSSKHADSLEGFRSTGLDVMTDLDVQTRPCWTTIGHDFPEPWFMMRMPGAPGPVPRGDAGGVAFAGPVPIFNEEPMLEEVQMADEDPEAEADAVDVRRDFPETWLWKLTRLGEDGRYVSTEDTPHTITEWVASAFCLSSDQGVGVAEAASVRTFQPFFLSYTIPYSVNRGEKVPVKVTVFNYIGICLSISLEMMESTNFTIESRPESEDIEVCGNSAETVQYEIRPSELGDIPVQVRASALATEEMGDNTLVRGVTPVTVTDAIEDTILVEPEGAEREETFSELICPSEDAGGVYETNVTLLLPSVIVPGSARGRIQVTGDIMGPVMSNLGGLLRMPYGCGEQNMIGMAPNIYVLQYLFLTDQMTVELKDKAVGFMRAGYQRELTYQLSDASYSAFGESDGEGSTWLTAFVLKCFSQAEEFITIDPNNLQRTRDWLAANERDENGCVVKQGRVIHREMQGSVLSPVTMTAFVTIALLESSMSPADPAVIQGLDCIKGGLDTQGADMDTYTLAISSYALGLGGYDTAQAEALAYLEDRKQGTPYLSYWTSSDQPAPEETICMCYCREDSSAVEITSYVLLALLTPNQPFSNGIQDIMRIVKWLNTQRNALGGFSSTQDTVLGLQVLSQFAAKAFNPSSSHTLSISVNGTRAPPSVQQEYMFEVNGGNTLVLQREDLVEVPTNMSVRAAGTGCALFQAELRYNVPVVAPTVELFNIEANIADTEGNAVADPTVCGDKTLEICVSYHGNGVVTGMAVVEVRMVSGYVPHEESLNQFQASEEGNEIGLKRFDKYKEGEPLSLYFDQFDATPRCVPIQLKQQIVVKDTKDAVIKVYDYYKPGVVGFEKYNTCEASDL